MSAIPMIRIKSEIPGCEGGLDINASDFDPAKHDKFEDQVSLQTREAISAMGKVEAREWLEAHGADIPRGADVKRLRETLTRLLFVDI